MWALVSARAEGIPIRALAAAIGLSPSRVHQIVAGADLERWTRRSVNCGQRAGRPPKTPTATRWPGYGQCAGWLRQLDGGRLPADG
jgi:hypothetical protein